LMDTNRSPNCRCLGRSVSIPGVMTRVFPKTIRAPFPFSLAGLCLAGILLASLPAFGHAGHSDHEFSSTGTAGTPQSVQVDPTTSDRIGIRVEPVTSQRFALGIKATGQIETLPNQQVKVTAPLTGTVVQLLVQPGDRVQAGDAVAVLTSPELATLRTEAFDRQTNAQGAIQTAEADLRLAQRNYDRQVQIAEAAVHQAQSELKLAQERYDRDRTLVAQGVIPSRTALESEAQLSAAKANVTAAQSRIPVSEATAQLDRARAAVQVSQSQLNLSDDAYRTRLQQLEIQPNAEGLVTVVAPISGAIANQTITPGESVNEPGVPLMTIVNGNGVGATANVYEKDLPRIAQGQRVRVKVAGVTNRFEGTISYIGTAVEGESRVVPVRATLANANGQLKPGMFAELELLTAIVNANGRSLVYVKNGQNYEPVEVTLGQVDGDRTEITKGLFEGDQVVVQGAPQLYSQSLRGANATPANSSLNPASPGGNAINLPWWAIGGGGAIALSTFLAGMVWANFRHRRAIATLLAQLNPEAPHPTTVDAPEHPNALPPTTHSLAPSDMNPTMNGFARPEEAYSLETPQTQTGRPTGVPP
jgi:membrane fusion protein, heavy metal efflux system